VRLARSTIRDVNGPYRVPATILSPHPLSSTAHTGPRVLAGQSYPKHAATRAETMPDGFTYEWTTLAFPTETGGQYCAFAFVLAVVFVFLVWTHQ